MENFKKYVAEFIGTCILVAIACGVAVVLGCDTPAGYVGTALAFGLVIVAMAYSIGNISGCHINPAVSFAMFLRKQLSLKDFIGYLVAQFLGGIVGALIIGLVCGSFFKDSVVYGSFGQNQAQLTLVSAFGKDGALGMALLVEVLLTFVFVLAIIGVTSKTDNKAVTGLVIGLSLTLVHLLGIGLTGTSVNPARSFGPALMALVKPKNTAAIEQIWIFIIGPMVGAALAALCYNFLEGKKDDKKPTVNVDDSDAE